MYQLYADSIEEDRKKREEVAVPAVETVQPIVKPKKRRQRRPTTVLRPTAPTKPPHVFAPVFTAPQPTAILDHIIQAVVSSPLPTLSIRPKARSANDEKFTDKTDSVEDSTEEDEETLFLLMAT